MVIQNSDNGLTYRADTADNHVVESSGGGGEVWVQAGNLQASSGPAANLINVEVSAMPPASAEALCAGAGTDNPVALTPPGDSGGLCAWRVHS